VLPGAWGHFAATGRACLETGMDDAVRELIADGVPFSRHLRGPAVAV